MSPKNIELILEAYTTTSSINSKIRILHHLSELIKTSSLKNHCLRGDVLNQLLEFFIQLWKNKIKETETEKEKKESSSSILSGLPKYFLLKLYLALSPDDPASDLFSDNHLVFKEETENKNEVLDYLISNELK